MKRVQILKTMHLGPIYQEVKEGDVLAWDKQAKIFTINGKNLDVSSINPEEAFDILERLGKSGYYWAKELPDTHLDVDSLEFKTNTQVVLPIIGCLKAAEEYITPQHIKTPPGGIPSPLWHPVNEDQYQFIKMFLPIGEMLPKLDDILKSKANTDVSIINAWLKDNGFDIQLAPSNDNKLAVASILNVLVQWITEGKVTSIVNEHGTYPAVSMKYESSNICKHMDRTIHPFPIISLKTKSEDMVYMTIADSIRKDTFGLQDKILKLQEIVRNCPGLHCDGATFPMIDYDAKVDISWLKGLSYENGYSIGEAIQQTKFRMNEIGAKAESAVAMSFRCMAGISDWVHINQPFILWIERPGVPIPVFSGVFCEDVWKKPIAL